MTWKSTRVSYTQKLLEGYSDQKLLVAGRFVGTVGRWNVPRVEAGGFWRDGALQLLYKRGTRWGGGAQRAPV